MKKFSFSISFMKSAKCCDFGGEVVAVNESAAKSSAREWAKMNGFNGAVKNIKVKEVTA